MGKRKSTADEKVASKTKMDIDGEDDSGTEDVRPPFHTKNRLEGIADKYHSQAQSSTSTSNGSTHNQQSTSTVSKTYSNSSSTSTTSSSTSQP